MSALPKPVLRGHIKRRGLRGLFGAFCVAGINGALYHFLISAPRKKSYEEFIKTYDAEAHYKDLLRWNYLSIQEALNDKNSS